MLSLLSNGADNHGKALHMMFQKFAAKKEASLSNLKDIYLICPDGAGVVYMDQYTIVLAEMPKTAVILHLRSTAPWSDMTSIGGL